MKAEWALGAAPEASRGPASDTSWLIPACLYALLVVAIYCVFGFQLLADSRSLLEVDGYMRLERVLQLHATGGWWDSVLHDSNAPYGEDQHWTRLLDMVLLLGAWVLQPFCGSFESALHWWGVVLAPLFHVAAAFAGCWALAPVVRRMGFLVLALLAQPTLWGYMMPGRPDHHGLLVAFSLIALGVMIRVSRGDLRRGLAVLSGTALGLGIWAAPEVLVVAALANIVFGIAWLVRGGDLARFAAGHALAMAAVIAVAIAVDYPPQAWGTVAYDKVSLPQLGCALAALGVWLSLALAGRWPMTAAGRVAAALVLVAAWSVALVVLFPQLAAGPLASVDPRLWDVWLSQVREMRPLLTYEDEGGKLLLFLGPIAMAGLGMALSIRAQGLAAWFRSGEAAVALFLAVFVILGLQQVRWTVYQGFAAAQPIAGLVALAEARIDRWRTREVLRSLARIGAMVVIILGTDIASLVMQSRDKGLETGRMKAHLAACDPTRISPVLDDPATAGPRAAGADKPILLSPINLSPALVYRTAMQVVGTPYHRNVAGILDTNAVFRATDDAAARAVLDRRGVDLVLLCAAMNGEGAGTLARDLLDGGARPWLTPVALPPEVAAAGFHLYRVVHQGAGASSSTE